ncbi:hypothetical protein [Actinomadura sp. KC216]|uniref:hypothetical protein n=1 Tax=Actinomadura sp. KC216 TaxID=2530370 RepID=UPI001A9E5EB6|nr:hypothetical protein [Actinomadura sp. KC216]
MFGDVPTLAERLIWRVLLGLRLAKGRSSDTVAGWQITGRGQNWFRLEAASWFLTGNLLVQAADGRVPLVTILRHDQDPWPSRVVPAVRSPSPTGARPAP